VIAEDGSVIAGTRSAEREFRGPEGFPMNTVLGVATVQAALGKRATRWLARRASDGVTTSVRPAHTRYDGDVAFAVAAPPRESAPPDLDLLGYLVTRAVADAVRNAVR
jgi:L-aminopeptidase/D-esterase-like protein